ARRCCQRCQRSPRPGSRVMTWDSGSLRTCPRAHRPPLSPVCTTCWSRRLRKQLCSSTTRRPAPTGSSPHQPSWVSSSTPSPRSGRRSSRRLASNRNNRFGSRLMRTSLRLGGGAGFAGDRLDARLDLAERGALDYLVLECLAERTIALAQLRRRQDPGSGYDARLSARVESLLPILRPRSVRRVSNFGAAHPLAAAD